MSLFGIAMLVQTFRRPGERGHGRALLLLSTYNRLGSLAQTHTLSLLGMLNTHWHNAVSASVLRFARAYFLPPLTPPDIPDVVVAVSYAALS
jgi:hypothetical protein